MRTSAQTSGSLSSRVQPHDLLIGRKTAQVQPQDLTRMSDLTFQGRRVLDLGVFLQLIGRFTDRTGAVADRMRWTLLIRIDFERRLVWRVGA